MGHIHLATLPATPRWKEVGELLSSGAPAEEVIAASAHAAEAELAVATRSPVLAEAVRLLSMLPQAARAPAFGEALRGLGLKVPDEPLHADLTFGLATAVDSTTHDTDSCDDFGGIVRRALLGTLNATIGAQLPDPFAAEPGDVRASVAHLGGSAEFPRVVRLFFGTLVADTLAYWLDRILAAHVGPGRRFPTTAERAAFDRALFQCCTDSTRFIRELSGAWYARTLYRDGTITLPRASAFTKLAFRRTLEQLGRKREIHA